MDSNRFVPFKINFDIVKKLDKWFNWLLIGATLLGVLLLVIGNIDPVRFKAIMENLNYGIGVLSIFYFIGDLAKRFLLQFAEQRRRKDFIDNSLDTQLAEQRSEGYFSNEGFDPGVYKMGINCFESAFFSMNISKKMITGHVIKSVAVIGVFGFLFTATDKVSLATVLQFALPYTILQQSIILVVFYLQVSSVFNYFKLLFSSAQREKRDLLIIHNVISYESTISWAGLVLDDDIYEKLNPALSERWEQIKSDHHINIE